MSAAAYGFDIGPSEFGPSGIVGRPERSISGNIVLRVGHRNEHGWEQTEHVVLTPDEARAFVNDLVAQLSGVGEPINGRADR